MSSVMRSSPFQNLQVLHDLNLPRTEWGDIVPPSLWNWVKTEGFLILRVGGEEAEEVRGDAARHEFPDEFVLVVGGELEENLSGARDRRSRRNTEEVVVADVAPVTTEEETV